MTPLLVQLAQANGHLAAAGAGGRHDDERLGGLHIVVAAEAFVGVDQGDVVGIAFDGVVVIDLDAHAFQALPIGFSAGLAVEVRDYHAVDAEAAGHEFVPEAEDIDIVGDAEVAADLVLLDVHGADDDDDFRIILHFHQHFQLAVRLEARQDAAGVEIVEQLAAEFHVQFIAEGSDTFLDVFRLDFEIFRVVEPVFHI